MSGPKKILWPIDPTNSDLKFDENLKAMMLSLSKVMDFEVQPVHVVSADFLLTGQYFEPIDQALLKENLENECEAYLKDFDHTFVNKTLVLNNHLGSRGAEMSIFSEFVNSYQPDFVLMASHGRKGWERVFMGSFAESILLSIQAPVIMIGPQCEPSSQLTKALMPVDLSENTQKFLEKFLDDHRLSFLKNINLFHKISMVDLEDVAWAPTLYGLGSYGSEDIFKHAKETTTAFLEAFMSHPLSQKRLSYSVSQKLEPASRVINQEAISGGFDLIVMRSEAGTLAASVLGSVTRDVIRESKKPVVVYPHLYE